MDAETAVAQELGLLRKKVAAQEKSLQVLMRRVEREASASLSALDRIRMLHDLEHLVASKTAELEEERSKLARALISLQDTQEQLLQSQKLEAVGQLAAGIAHDFNNLLTVIGGHADMLLRNELKEEGPTRDAVEEISLASGRAAALTRQLLAFSRKQNLQPEVMDLNQSITRMKGLLQRLIGEHIDLVIRLKPGLGLIKADPSQIEQILMNLAVNARDAMPTGGRLTLSTSSVDLDGANGSSGPHVLLRVSDSGTGMSAETKAKAFEPFFTTKERGRGTGLGLSTVYGIVKQSGGNILVDSEPGKGSSFRLYLPVTQESALPAAAAAASSSFASQSGTVLLVEDEDALRSLLKGVLHKAGYTVLDTGDPEEALRVCRGPATLDLLLTDVVMPHKQGPTLAQEAQALRPGLKVLFMSGYPDSCLDPQSGLSTASPLIEKPISPQALLARLQDCLAA